MGEDPHPKTGTIPPKRKYARGYWPCKVMSMNHGDSFVCSDLKAVHAFEVAAYRHGHSVQRKKLVGGKLRVWLLPPEGFHIGEDLIKEQTGEQGEPQSSD